jgi:hypothetical protein
MNKMLGKVCLVLAATGLCPAWGDIGGSWSATAVARIDVAVLNGNVDNAETTVAITTGDYNFNRGGEFIAGDIRGIWTEKWDKYSVFPDYDSLASSYAKSLESRGFTVNTIKVLNSRINGAHYANGILGQELHRYRIDINDGANRLVLKVTTHVDIGAYEPDKLQGLLSLSPLSQDAQPSRSIEDFAAEAVAQRIRAMNAAAP